MVVNERVARRRAGLAASNAAAARARPRRGCRPAAARAVKPIPRWLLTNTISNLSISSTAISYSLASLQVFRVQGPLSPCTDYAHTNLVMRELAGAIAACRVQPEVLQHAKGSATLSLLPLPTVIDSIPGRPCFYPVRRDRRDLAHSVGRRPTARGFSSSLGKVPWSASTLASFVPAQLAMMRPDDAKETAQSSKLLPLMSTIWHVRSGAFEARWSDTHRGPEPRPCSDSAP